MDLGRVLVGSEATEDKNIPPRNIPMISGPTPSPEISRTGAPQVGRASADEKKREEVRR